MERLVPPTRCGYPTKSGSPCKNPVDKAGQPCRIHARAALLSRIMAGRGGDDAAVDQGDG